MHEQHSGLIKSCIVCWYSCFQIEQLRQCTAFEILLSKGAVDTPFMCLKHQQNELSVSKECHIESTALTCPKRQLSEPNCKQPAP